MLVFVLHFCVHCIILLTRPYLASAAACNFLQSKPQFSAASLECQHAQNPPCCCSYKFKKTGVYSETCSVIFNCQGFVASTKPVSTNLGFIRLQVLTETEVSKKRWISPLLCNVYVAGCVVVALTYCSYCVRGWLCGISPDMTIVCVEVSLT